jgi:hypothetical protein
MTDQTEVEDLIAQLRATGATVTATGTALHVVIVPGDEYTAFTPEQFAAWATQWLGEREATVTYTVMLRVPAT